MEIERGSESTGKDQESEQQPLEVIPENTSRYEQAIEGLPLMGKRPDFIVIDQDDQAYIGRKDAAEIADISKRYMSDLISRQQVKSTTLNGHERYVHLDSLVSFILFDRRPRGRPRKTKT